MANPEPTLTDLIQAGLKMQPATPTPTPVSDEPRAKPPLAADMEQGNGMGDQDDKSKLVVRVSTGTC